MSTIKPAPARDSALTLPRIENRIVVLRGLRLVIDADSVPAAAVPGSGLPFPLGTTRLQG
jgi:hypothetical protein